MIANLYLVLGLGESGLAMTQWLCRQGQRVRVADSRAQPPGLAELRQLIESNPHYSIEPIFGPFADALLEGASHLALSPGLSLDEALVKKARAKKIVITGEIELFAQGLEQLGWRAASKIIAITGTNGKTTTTALAGELVRECGLDAAVAGNISPAALTELMYRVDTQRRPDVWVLELSSFQLETTTRLNADAAAVLNVTEDHLDRHVGMQAYANAKERIYAGDGVQVINREDAFVERMVHPGRRVLSFGLNPPSQPNEFGLAETAEDIFLMHGNKRLVAANELKLAGRHNLSNALAALALGEAIGLAQDKMLKALCAFQGLPHRVQLVAQRSDGVKFYDDSKGTNVGATVAAIAGLADAKRKIVLIAGGDGKGQDFTPLRDALIAHARSIILIGRDADKIAAVLAGSNLDIRRAADMDLAVEQAMQCAQAKDIVLLSPACASLDMFKNYAHRAEVFVQAVHRALEGGELL